CSGVGRSTMAGRHIMAGLPRHRGQIAAAQQLRQAHRVTPVKMNTPHDTLAAALFMWKAAIIILTVATTIFSSLAALAAASAKCVGMDLVTGYRSGVSDFLAWPLMSIVAVVALMIRTTTAKVRKRITSNGWFPVFSSSSARAFLICSVLLGFVGF